MSPRQKPRRGVLLLVVLSLLVLFVLAGVTFLIVSGQYRRTATRMATIERRGELPGDMMDSSIKLLLRGRGTAIDDATVIDRHAILRDLYGVEYVIGEVADLTSSPAPPAAPQFDATSGVLGTGGQLMAFYSLVIPPAIIPPPPESREFGSGFYNGGVITMVSGVYAGQSRRIIEYSEEPVGPDTWRRLVVESFGFSLPEPLPKSGDRYVINGLPFNGTGAGMSLGGPTSYTMDTQVAFASGRTYPSAILPNYLRYPAGSPPPELGGMDESYDAADFQNMFLAWVPTTADTNHRIIPSFHRPSIINYIADAEPTGIDTTSNPDLWRSVFMRPVPYGSFNEHFTGSNPGFDPILGPWDVDNDGDGLRDSVWLDLGFPAQSDATGVSQKPLFAFMCVDLDGRLNLNVHGNLAHVEDIFLNDAPTGGVAAGGVATLSGHPRGEGYGPAEVFLGAAFTELSSAQQRSMMAAIFSDRYGQEGWPAADKQPGLSPADDDSVFPWRYTSLPTNFFAAPPTVYSSRPDLRGLLATYIDHAGQARMEDGDGIEGQTVISTGTILESIDDPYELNVLATNGTDTPFGTGEMEALLRGNDASLRPISSRLVALGLAGDSPSTSYRRRIFTTRSFSNPAPLVMPFDPALRTAVFSATGSPSTNIRTLFLAAGFMTAAAVEQALAFELAHGERFNVNRLFGDGVDNNGNGVVDEPGEINDLPVNSTGQTVQDGMVAQFASLPPPPQAPFRQLFARHLYCLMYAISSVSSIDLDLDGFDEHQRALAQWAINVVDYRDPDAIMTPFEYDLNPFDGWDVDGNPSTDEGATRGIVWGMERPELLITETVAFHDRRTQDLAIDDGPGGGDDVANGDTDFDQEIKPRGSLFVELYNPWVESANLDALTTTNVSRDDVTSHPPAEFYSLDASSQNEGLDLAAMSPGGTPVWRLLVCITQGDGSLNPSGTSTLFDDLTETGIPIDSALIERAVFFTTTTGPGSGSSIQYSANTPPALLKAGRYAVVGSGDQLGGQFITTLGKLQGAPNLFNTRRIVLEPSVDPNQNQVTRFTQMNAAVEDTLAGGNVQPAVAVVIGSTTASTHLNISEPIGGYPPYDVAGAYDPPKDTPLDLGIVGLDPPRLGVHDVAFGFRAILLQRLANPLLDHNASTNPYITINWMNANLQTFDGEEDSTAVVLGNPAPGAFERGQSGEPLWAHEVPTTTAVAMPGTGDHIFDFQLPSTLGYLNSTYSAVRNSGVGHPAYIGQPVGTPFPWINWRNKPYVTHYELLGVPKSAAWHFPLDFSVNQTGAFNEYEYTSGNANLSYRHMFPIRSRANAPAEDHGLYQLMDLIEVPDRFAGTELWGNPDHFSTATTDGFRPPFHRISRFRVPGRVNINTIPDTVSESRVWNAVAAAGGGPAWVDVENSRRGYPVPATGPYPHLDPALPTQFAAPFRSSALADLVPPPIPPQAGVDAGLLRANVFATGAPLFASFDTLPYRNGNINPYFRNLPAQRLGNIISYHSNVFAVWVSVGFFEFDATNGLGKEVGADSGQIKRHRSFYVIDRSIPVAYEPGQDHNVEDTIILRRQLE